MPRVSVIMPFYNAARYLKQSVESILNQTFRDFEFILIDDGSTDGSYDIARGFNDERIVLHRQERNMGLIRSLNRALAMVSSDVEFVARMDADDWSYPARF
jgi:glycosyltransferase involved in cell wall biosynthesis